MVTDERPMCDATKGIAPPQCVSGRPYVAPGTKIAVPNYKLKYDRGNPTGHGVIFVTPQYSDETGQPSGYNVLCYVVPGGV